MSLRTEVSIVALVAFGYFIVSAVHAVLTRNTPHISERNLEHLLLYEAVILLALGGFLHLRDWTLTRIGFRPSVVDSLIGVGLVIATYLVAAVLWLTLTAVNLAPRPLNGAGTLVVGPLSVVTAIAISVLNPLFEELFVCGYVITLAKEKGHIVLGVNASVAIRLAYHLYQGSAGVVGVVPFGLLCAWWYARTGRLWPVITAHAVSDLTSLLLYVH